MFENLLTSLKNSLIIQDSAPDPGSKTLNSFFEKLSESSRSKVKRCKERCLEEAVQLLRQTSVAQLRSLEEKHLLLLARLLISLQLEMASISTACRKVDQMLLHLTKVDHQLVYRETLHSFHSIVYRNQVLSLEDLQRACMFLEDSSVGREVWRDSYKSMLIKVSELLPVVLQDKSLRDGPLCYVAVKVCLQIFQLLSRELAPHVWEQDSRDPAVQMILQALMDIILGQCSNRDARLLAGTAVAMLINTASESRAGGEAAWGLLQVSHQKPWQLMVGALKVRCDPSAQDGVDRLAVCRGLLTCCRPHILRGSQDDSQTCLLLDGLFPLVYSLCEEKLDCHCFAFEALTLWLKRVKESVDDLWRMTGVRLLPENSLLLQQLQHIIWTNAESPIDGVPEFVNSAFLQLLSLFNQDCEKFSDANTTFFFTLLQRTMKLPWETRALYHRLGALLPYLGTDTVLDQYPELFDHLLKCLSTNHLSPCGSELYKCLIQQQRRELCGGSQNSSCPTEVDLAKRWAKRWQPFVLEALRSDVTLLQSSSSSHLLPATFQVFPSAVDLLLASLDPQTHRHLRAWTCILSCYRAVTGSSPWSLQGGSTMETLQVALRSADDKIRLAALSLLCCSSKTKDAPSKEELVILRGFIPQNLNCESSLFRQGVQASVRKFLVRIRDGCLAQIRRAKSKKDEDAQERMQSVLEQIEFVEWLSQLPYSFLTPGHSYQRKKTVLLLLSAVLETCTDTWSPDKKKGQPPANMGALIACARQRGLWDFFSRTKQLVLISRLEDSTNEIRELSSELLLRFFPSTFPEDVIGVLDTRTKQLLCSPRVQEAQMGALMMKVLIQKSGRRCEAGGLVEELEVHYLTAKSDTMLAARTKPIHGVLCALRRCLLETPERVCDALDHSVMEKMLGLLEDISLLLITVLYGDSDTCNSEKYAPPSFCDMGNAISSLISQQPGGGAADEEDCVLLSEEHSLVLTCCWVSLKEIGIFLGALVEKVLTESKEGGRCLLTKPDLSRAANVFKDILLKCRHWGAVEGCCAGFTKFCASLLSSSDTQIKDIPAQMLEEGLQVVRCPRSASVTRRAAGLPVLIQCVLSAEDTSRSRPLLASSMETLMHTAASPLDPNWDQTRDLPQVCAVHTLQALVRGAALGAAVLQFAPAVVMLSLAQLSSACWAMRNAALQLYSSVCSRMLGQRCSSEDGVPPQHSLSPDAFFFHYPALEPFLLGELRGAAQNLQGPHHGAKLRLQPSLYPILTLLAQLQPGIHDSSETLLDFLPPLLQLSASPIYGVRVMASKALVAMTPPSRYTDILLNLSAQLPRSQQECCSHNQLHGQLLQIRAVVDRALCSHSDISSDLHVVMTRVQTSMWLVTGAQRCPLVRAAYISVVDCLRGCSCDNFLSQLSDRLIHDLIMPQEGLQVGLSSFYGEAVRFLCADPKWACEAWRSFSATNLDVKLSLVASLLERSDLQQKGQIEVVQMVLQSHLKEALLSNSVEYRTAFLAALARVMADSDSPQRPPQSEPFLAECLDLLLKDLEEQKGGPEFLSQALNASSLLLSRMPNSSLKLSGLQRWCGILESQRSPDAPEVLRMACSEALCVAGLPLISSMREQNPLSVIIMRLINTGLYLLQDQNQQVRLKAAHFSSLLHRASGGNNEGSASYVQVNLALPLLLETLLQECWEAPGTLEVLLSHLPPSDLRPVLAEASAAGGCTNLYEQDEANVFAEPSVMSAHVLPYLLQLAEKSSQSSVLAQTLHSWAEGNAAQVLDHLTVCEKLQPAETLTPSWLALLTDPRFHITLCGLLSRVAFLPRLQELSAGSEHFCDPLSVQERLQDVCKLLGQNGVHFPSDLTAAVAGGLLE
ncbi:tRNA (32-2'-O)-methyltransferase regulator THADA isoform X1 [Nothobranchius furzeri]|uniref:Uncharacterized protein n=1 Tax=Nothobranchius furzeri TaxID=105023 RepID=A0A1A7ZE78_NOTFU